MATLLTHRHSPLQQVRRHRAVQLTGRPGGLSQHDEAILVRLLDEPVDFMDHKSFHRDDAEKALFEDVPKVRVPNTDWYHPLMNSFGEDGSRNNQAVVLTAKEERILFLQYNYCRFRTAQVLRRIDRDAIDADLAREALHWHGRARQLRDQIAATNLALVLAMAKRFRGSELDYADLISEGNMALLRAIDKFDAAKGYKLSTYACRAILKGFSRIGIKVSRYRNLFPAAFDAKMEKSDHMDRKRQQQENDCVDDLRTIIRDNRANLTEMERKVIQHRFQIDDDGRSKPNRKKLTLEQVGKLIGVTKERVRQIQHKAYEKLRASMEADFLT